MMFLLRSRPMTAVGIIISILSLELWPNIPSLWWIIPALLTLAICVRYSFAFGLQGVLIGFVTVIVHSSLYIERSDTLSQELENITINGRIDSLFKQKNQSSEFIFAISQINGKTIPYLQRPRLQLYWQSGQNVKLGQQWQFTVKARLPYGRVNEAGFDLERYFVSNRLHGVGHVMSGVLVEDTMALRQQWFDRVVHSTSAYLHQPLVLALSFGFRDELNDQHWQILRDSGLAHLMAISGLHIGLAFAFGWWLGRWFKAFLPESTLLIWLPMVSAVVLSCGYAWLAGFSLPTVRALIMCLVFSGCTLFRLHWAKWQSVLFTLLVCLLFDPFSVLSPGFWLSFGAVIILIAGLSIKVFSSSDQSSSWLLRWQSKVKLALFLQALLFVFLIPIQIENFGGMSLVSPLINFIVIPWVSMITVPLVLFGLMVEWLSGSLSEILWLCVSWSLVPVWEVAQWGVGYWLVISTHYLPQLMVGAVVVITALLMPWRKIRWWLMSMILVIVYPKPSTPEWKVDILDVGHGLAVLIERNGEAILYDTGNRWLNNSIADRVIKPILHQRSIPQLEGVILSHADSDHAGGIESISHNFEPKWRRSSDRRDGFMPCIQGYDWQWQGLTFEVLWPPKQVKRAFNPHSCVILLSDGEHSLLLTGDIDGIAEMLMLNQYPSLTTDVLLVPHHGSLTSSSLKLIEHVQPKYAIASTAKYNPWNLPAKTIVERYQIRNVKWLETADSGQITLKFNRENRTIIQHRKDNKMNWYRKLFGALSVKE